jgi:uncharacterized membrane protein YdbT with pleckstrin-like domain
MIQSPSLGSVSTMDSPRIDPSTITRPDTALLRYYFVVALLTVVGFPFTILPLLFKYYSLKYHFDESGVSIRWGVLFRREVHLTYRRIQDIHLTRNLIQRWMGLATIGIQTASGSSGPEMSIEGVLQAEQLRDYLYTQMRGAKETTASAGSTDHAREPDAMPADDEALVLLSEIRDELRRVTEGRARS